jgi:hypothetical protein
MRRLLRKTSPSSRWREEPISKHINGLGTNKRFGHVSRRGPNPKNDYAGEDQEQFTGFGPTSSQNFCFIYGTQDAEDLELLL